MRSMELKYDGIVLYQSFFDEKTGNCLRSVEGGSYDFDMADDIRKAFDEHRKRFKNSYWDVCSPSPEMMDISITNKCGFGCSYCYQSSQSDGKHARQDLVEKTLLGFETVPYQIAIGGGEPTLHPDLPYILGMARGIGTIPNLTTNGSNLTPEIMDAINEVCGGVALSYHQHKGLDYFRRTYMFMKENLNCQLNVHLIADNMVIKGIEDLISLHDEIGPVSLVLLGYHPTGRGFISSCMTRTTYTRDLPNAIRKIMKLGANISFSEGLLPYFISRPEIGVNTAFAMYGEGQFSCYVDTNGRMHRSSFNLETDTKSDTIFNKSSQSIWEEGFSHVDTHFANDCYFCTHKSRCRSSCVELSMLCGKNPINKLPLKS